MSASITAPPVSNGLSHPNYLCSTPIASSFSSTTSPFFFSQACFSAFFANVGRKPAPPGSGCGFFPLVTDTSSNPRASATTPSLPLTRSQPPPLPSVLLTTARHGISFFASSPAPSSQVPKPATSLFFYLFSCSSSFAGKPSCTPGAPFSPSPFPSFWSH